MSRKRMRDVMTSISRRATNATHKSKIAVRDLGDLAGEKMLDGEVTYNDLAVQFIGASGIPKMDVVGSADPYFIADLDGQISIV